MHTMILMTAVSSLNILKKVDSNFNPSFQLSLSRLKRDVLQIGNVFFCVGRANH